MLNTQSRTIPTNDNTSGRFSITVKELNAHLNRDKQTAYAPVEDADQAQGVPIPPRHADQLTDVAKIPYFVMHTLTASYWYRKAYDGQPLDYPAPSNRFAYHRALFYEKLASQYRTDEGMKDYHKAYRAWQSSGFDCQKFEELMGWSFFDSEWAFI